jgi:diaminopimelate decarboxylase
MLENRLSIEYISSCFKKALVLQIFNPEIDTTVVLYDIPHFEQRLDMLEQVFGESTLHAIAIKANPLIRLLQKIKNKGFGVEVASAGELFIAKELGFEPAKIVFDSPIKTLSELENALKMGVHINADSLIELGRINSLLKKIKSTSTIGIRINPQVGTGKIWMSSVAGEYSKFGVPIKQFRQELTEAFLNYAWLKGVHLHIGSQGCDWELLKNGIHLIFEFAENVNQILNENNSNRQIEFIDIGGGLPVSYSHFSVPLYMKDYATKLKNEIPGLFSGKYKIITEFGRWVHANCGSIISRIEYVKEEQNVNTAMIHVGADMLLRECYRPEDWTHEFSVLDNKGNLKTNMASKLYNIAGPLCFSGDFVARNIELPIINEGDYLVIHDCGAYTFSMWSRYNSRQFPQIAGYNSDNDSFEILKEKEELEYIWKFWQ